jgi:hypothetical protein
MSLVFGALSGVINRETRIDPFMMDHPLLKLFITSDEKNILIIYYKELNFLCKDDDFIEKVA